MPPNNVIHLPESEGDLQQQAIDWVVRLNSGEASKNDREAFTQWISRSDEHRQAFFAARDLWRQMDSLALPETDRPQAAAASVVAETAAPRRLGWRHAVALTAVLAVALSMKPVYIRYMLADYRTAVGEIKIVRLADGSTIRLNTDTLIAEHYSDQQRGLELLAGEAEFEVAHDKQRPFVVKAGNGSTRALGTRFIVDAVESSVRVSVLENAVEISSRKHAPVKLETGYELAYSDGGLTDVPRPIAENERLAWRDGKLKFNAKPLAEVIEEINRYLPGTIVLANQAYAEHKVNGVFEIDRLDNAVHVIAQSLDLQIAGLGRFLRVIY